MTAQLTAAPRAASTRRAPVGRMALLVLVAAAALAGLDAALLRLGAVAPVRSESLARLHGPLMVQGFLGTAIALERAVALRVGGRRGDAWGFAAPVLGAAGTLLALAQVAGAPVARAVPAAAWAVGMASLCAIYLGVWRRQASAAVLVQALGAVAGLGGALLWLRGLEVAALVPWWAGFLVLTVIGERVELARVAFASERVETRVVAEACAVAVALVAALVSAEVGYTVLGVALGVLVVDVGLRDVARRTIRLPGAARLMAACMIAGYGWAMVTAVVWAVGGPAWDGWRYDASVHALTIGFALSMVVAHAPVIVPALARRPLPYHPVMWVGVGLLHGGLVLRVVAGARGAEPAWRLGGAVGVVAVLVVLVTVVALLAGRRAGS